MLAWPGPASSRAAGGLAEQAYRAIRNAIQEGQLEAGQRVLELELCAWLKVSRTPIREAMRRLQSDGMLVHAPGGGLSVAQHDLRAVAELYDVRERLEGTAAALAARFADRDRNPHAAGDGGFASATARRPQGPCPRKHAVPRADLPRRP